MRDFLLIRKQKSTEKGFEDRDGHAVPRLLVDHPWGDTDAERVWKPLEAQVLSGCEDAPPAGQVVDASPAVPCEEAGADVFPRSCPFVRGHVQVYKPILSEGSYLPLRHKILKETLLVRGQAVEVRMGLPRHAGFEQIDRAHPQGMGRREDEPMGALLFSSSEE